MFQFIQQQTELVDVLQQMDQCSTYGLDTEFIKVDTLWPKLGVCQVNVNGNVYLLDGVSLDLSEFWKKIFLAQQNIFHACGEDIDLIYHYADEQNLLNVFDTQVGLSFLGHGLQVSYQGALTRGTATLKDAVDSAFEEYLKDPKNFIYAIGSVVGPHPFPKMVRDFQSIIGKEIKEQTHQRFGKNPNYVVACVGGGSNAIGVFTAFLNDSDVKLVGVEPAGHGLDTNMHSATLTLGKPSQIHGMACYVLENEDGEPLPVHSIASGLDYPGVGPQHSFLKDLGRVEYSTATDQECLDAFMTLSRVEGIVPALESSHAVAWAIREAPKLPKETMIVVNLSGRGDKDSDYVAEKLKL
ncbi:pyridoxal-phosphate dependent enzyme [Acinetobacter baumannii]|nr:pyridoxal-phosphate dependent enzyme [Acinetobacter baumannii]MCZ3160372.1 pyridoxal-phosphate dependent enzyme [Acinetobacter baumannii]